MSTIAAALIGAALFAAVLALTLGLSVLLIPRLTIVLLVRLTAALATWYGKDKGERYGGS